MLMKRLQTVFFGKTRDTYGEYFLHIYSILSMELILPPIMIQNRTLNQSVVTKCFVFVGLVFIENSLRWRISPKNSSIFLCDRSKSWESKGAPPQRPNAIPQENSRPILEDLLRDNDGLHKLLKRPAIFLGGVGIGGIIPLPSKPSRKIWDDSISWCVSLCFKESSSFEQKKTLGTMTTSKIWVYSTCC